MAKGKGGMRTVFKVISKHDPLWIFCTLISPTYFGNLPLAQVCGPLWIKICHEITSPSYNMVPLRLVLPLHLLWGNCQPITELPGLSFPALEIKITSAILTSLDHCDLGGKGMNCAARCINRMKWGSLQGCFPEKLKSTMGHRGISLTSLLLLSQNVWHLNLVDLGSANLFYTLTEHCKSGLTLMKCARLLSIHQSSEWVATLGRKLPLPFNVIMVQLRGAYHLAKADCIS